MSIGKLYLAPYARCNALYGLVNHYKLDVEISGADEQFEKNFPLKKYPSLLLADGTPVHEFFAVAFYLLNFVKDESIKPQNDLEHAQFFEWISFANSELVALLFKSFGGLVGRAPYDKKLIDDSQKELNRQIKLVFEPHLTKNTYLVGDRLTFADYAVAGLIFRGFELLFDKEWRKSYPAISRWYKTVVSQPFYDGVKLTITDEKVKYVPKKD